MRRRIYCLTAAIAVLAIPTAAAAPPSPEKHRHGSFVVKGGQYTLWQSRNLGREASEIKVRVGRRPVAFTVVPRSNSCIAYGHWRGIIMRMSDCKHGKRQPRFTIRAFSMNRYAPPVRVRVIYR